MRCTHILRVCSELVVHKIVTNFQNLELNNYLIFILDIFNYVVILIHQ